MKQFELSGKHYIDTILLSGVPAVIYGMGNGADKVMDLFNEKGIAVLGVTASDDFVRGQEFRGFTVKRLSEFNGDFIITPAFGTSIAGVMNHLIELNNNYRLLYPSVPVIGNEIADDKFFIKYSGKINEAYSLLSPESRRVFEGYLNFLYTGKLEFLMQITSPKEEIFNSYLKLDGHGTYIDIGAYNGDTVYEYLKYTGGKYEEITALEPDKKNFSKLAKQFDKQERILLLNKVCSDTSGEVFFNSKGGRQSSVSDAGSSVPSITIDEIAYNKTVSYIKIDAEGEEEKIITGAQNTIKRCKPKLNIALYHKFRDIFEIPLKIAEINPDYRFEIRHHPYIPGWDTNLYCV